MNAREIEQAVKTLQADLGAMREAVREQGDELGAVRQVASFAGGRTESHSERILQLAESLTAVQAELVAMREAQDASRAAVEAITSRLEELAEKVEGRNRSAAVKRNMTDADAGRVLSGDLAAAGHKEAAEAMGLTYAQVYSCRLGFTFKYVHRDLERSGWKSKWAKG